MAKPGRNDLCPCGSGNKHKKCCLPKEEAAEREQLAKAEARRVESAATHRLPLREVKAAITAILSGVGDAEEDELTIASNAAADLVRAGKLDEAEQAARDLQVRFPEVHDGYDRLGMVHEARRENRQAADCYQAKRGRRYPLPGPDLHRLDRASVPLRTNGRPLRQEPPGSS